MLMLTLAEDELLNGVSLIGILVVLAIICLIVWLVRRV